MKAEIVVWCDSGMMIDKGWQNVDFYIHQACNWKGEVTTIGSPIYEDERVLILGLSFDAVHDNWYGAQLIAKHDIISRDAYGPSVL